MKRFVPVFIAFGLATAGSTALAAQADGQIQPQDPKPQLVRMTEVQLDNVAAGQPLIQVVVIDAVDVRDVDVLNNLRLAVPVNAAVAAGVLSSAPVGSTATQGVGINQGNRR